MSRVTGSASEAGTSGDDLVKMDAKTWKRIKHPHGRNCLHTKVVVLIAGYSEPCSREFQPTLRYAAVHHYLKNIVERDRYHYGLDVMETIRPFPNDVQPQIDLRRRKEYHRARKYPTSYIDQRRIFA